MSSFITKNRELSVIRSTGNTTFYSRLVQWAFYFILLFLFNVNTKIIAQSCNWTVTITTLNSFADEVSWTLKSNGITVLSGGGTDFGVYTDNVNNVSGPLEFYIEAMGIYDDNEPAYTVSNGSTTVVSGQLYGGDDATYSNLNCAGGGGGNPPGPNSCNWTVTITTLNSFADEVSWTLKSNGITVLSGGGTDFGVYTDNVNNVSGPLEFYIEAMGIYDDNEPAYTVSNGSTTVVSGQLYGGDDATYSNLNCAGGGGGNPPNPSNDIIPTVCTNQTFTLQAGSSLHFYDDGGPGGSCNTDVAPGNFANAGCETITTICAAPGEYLIADFFVFSMFNTNSGFDWMVIYDGPNTSSPILFDNRVGAPDNPIGTDCTYNGGLTPCATGRCLTFRFNGTSVVSREGWDALITSTPVQCSPLPVELSHFSANCDKHVILSWATESELNSEKFIVEKSRSGAHWEVVDEVDAAGNSNSHLAYSLTDYNPNNGISYYRLRQVDFDGKEEVFGPISANCEGIDNSMIAYPNPNNGNFTVEINSSVEINDAVIQLADMTGKIVSSQVVQVANGVSQISIEKSEYLNRGTYVLKVLNAEKYFAPVKVVVK